MKRSTPVWIAVALSASLAACSGAGPNGTLPNGGTASAGTTKTSIVIRVPRRAKRRNHYVSPSTRSLSIAIAPAAGCSGCSPAVARAMDLDPGSPNCVDAPAGTTCTLSLVLGPGSYAGSIVTYDGPLDGSNTPTGKVLSKDQTFPFAVVRGRPTFGRLRSPASRAVCSSLACRRTCASLRTIHSSRFRRSWSPVKA